MNIDGKVVRKQRITYYKCNKNIIRRSECWMCPKASFKNVPKDDLHVFQCFYGESSVSMEDAEGLAKDYLNDYLRDDFEMELVNIEDITNV